MDGTQRSDGLLFSHGVLGFARTVCGRRRDQAFGDFGCGSIRDVCAKRVLVRRATGCDKEFAASRAALTSE